MFHKLGQSLAERIARLKELGLDAKEALAAAQDEMQREEQRLQREAEAEEKRQQREAEAEEKRQQREAEEKRQQRVQEILQSNELDAELRSQARAALAQQGWNFPAPYQHAHTAWWALCLLARAFPKCSCARACVRFHVHGTSICGCLPVHVLPFVRPRAPTRMLVCFARVDMCFRVLPLNSFFSTTSTRARSFAPSTPIMLRFARPSRRVRCACRTIRFPSCRQCVFHPLSGSFGCMWCFG